MGNGEWGVSEKRRGRKNKQTHRTRGHGELKSHLIFRSPGNGEQATFIHGNENFWTALFLRSYSRE
ncbi:MAG: hypothetical protein F6K47_34920 [Symploca sp. SIO2E6]|nr:hypothetical protein [Symploca sp. SIO2E6]